MRNRLLSASLASALGVTVLIGGATASAQSSPEAEGDSPPPAEVAEPCGDGYVSERNGVWTVAPNGVDDTDNLECAINEAGTHWRKTVRLTEGTFYSDFLFVEGYHGTIKGAGRGLTTIEPLAGGLDCTTEFEELGFVFWLILLDSNPTITDLALSIPDVACAEPYLEIFDIDPETQEEVLVESFQDFQSMVLVPTRAPFPTDECGGLFDAGLTVRRVDVDAPQPDFDAPVFNPQGTFGSFNVVGTTPIGCDTPDQVRGPVIVTDVSADGAGSLIQASSITDSVIRVANSYAADVEAAVVLARNPGTHAVVQSNVFEGVTGVGVVLDNCDGGPSQCLDRPSTGRIRNNDISMAERGFTGIGVFDGFFVPPQMNVDVRQNRISGDGNFAGVFLEDARFASVKRNTFTGASAFGVLAVGTTTQSQIAGNDLTGHTAFEAGILLDEGTSNNWVRANRGATVVDLGTDNRVRANTPPVFASARAEPLGDADARDTSNSRSYMSNSRSYMSMSEKRS